MLESFFSQASQPLGSVIVGNRGVYKDVNNAIRGENPGSGPGIYRNKAGQPFESRAAAELSDYQAQINGGYF